MGEEDGKEWMVLLFGRYGKRLNGLRLGTLLFENWIPLVEEQCPSRWDLSELESFELNRHLVDDPHKYTQWIAAMVSAPPQQSASSLPCRSLNSVQEDSSTASDVSSLSSLTSSSGTPYLWRPLSRIRLNGIRLQHQDWTTVIKALDFTALEILDLTFTNFDEEELQVLVDCVPEESNRAMPLTTSLQMTPIFYNAAILRLVAALKKKAPYARIFDIDMIQRHLQ
ncbi:hypothetical protein BC939DRAFT_459673 [Gamsiella multidivaricata]|uniref:uncharacterized protein n=1 Tax=Gamsiella multidivaricata TaxID=101098 RepID=UPI00221E5A26|nr:uncharacterized protein BC939DRAFT_459673 [Gamsiella multidivaricata]KAI7819584.1 hypothetical protein BC939DRAFT_459673 [Gamsiella multidivaricata]